MAKQKVLTDRLNTYFTKNKITIGDVIPSTGSYVAGDIVISSSPNSNAFGWICVSSGIPGSWKILKSGNDITKVEVEKILTGNITSHTHNYAASSSAGGSANSAVKLSTARTINGVSFDGTENITVSDNTKLPLKGGTVTGETVFLQGTRIHSVEGSAGSAGYVNIAQILINGNYANQPFTFTFSQRGNGTVSRVHVAFTSVNSTDPAIDNFNVEGPGDVYIRKSATSTWQLYIKKTETYDKIDILDFNKGKYATGISITWKDALVSSVPSGFVKAESRAYHKHRLMDLHMINDSDGYPVGNSSTTPIGTLYCQNSSKNHATRLSCYHNTETTSDYTTVGLYNLDSKSLETYMNIYPDYAYFNKKLHVNGPIRISGNYLSIQSSAPSNPSAGDIWIDI